MKRRKALKAITITAGGSLIIASFSSCTSDSYTPLFFSKSELALVDEISETILPHTDDSPGAKDAKVANFVDTYIHDCYQEEEQQLVRDGLIQFNHNCNEQFNKNFLNITSDQRTNFLKALDQHASESTSRHYFSMLKNTIVFSFFTSQEGVEKALEYIPVPGKYIGDYQLKSGQKTWAL